MTNSSTTNRYWLLSPAGLTLVVAVFTGSIAWWLLALPVFNLTAAANHGSHFPYVFVHTVGGTIMLVAGAANLYIGATRQHFRTHKPLGYAYVIGGAIGSFSAIVLALSNGHLDPPVAFEVTILAADDAGWALASLGMAWLGATAMAVRAARNRRYESHRAWMVRSYVLVWAFVLCRLVSKTPLSTEIGAGTAIIWLSWIVPLLLCEVVLQWRAGGRQSLPASGTTTR